MNTLLCALDFLSSSYIIVLPTISIGDEDFKNFSILMIGRLLGGVATSLLFSVFEAWLIGAHSSAGVMVRIMDDDDMILHH
jgi:hypothetical protein